MKKTNGRSTANGVDCCTDVGVWLVVVWAEAIVPCSSSLMSALCQICQCPASSGRPIYCIACSTEALTW